MKVLLTKDEKMRFQAIADAMGLSLSSWIRDAVCQRVKLLKMLKCDPKRRRPSQMGLKAVKILGVLGGLLDRG